MTPREQFLTGAAKLANFILAGGGQIASDRFSVSHAMEQHLQRFRFFYLGLLSVGFFYATGLHAIRPLLSYDELFTFYVASLPDTSSVIQALLNGADNHPPLDYLVRHISLRIFGESELAFRFPSMVALGTAALSLYGFVSKRAGAVPGIVAFCFIMSTSAMGYATEGRSYSIWIASMCITLWTWQRATENPRSIVALVLLVVALMLGPYSHFYGVLNFVPIIVGEGLRSLLNRRLSIPMLVSILVSMVLLIPLYPFAQNVSEYREIFWAGSFSIRSPFGYYEPLLENVILAAVASLLSCTVIILVKGTKGTDDSTRIEKTIPAHEIAAAVTLCLTPFIAYGLAVLYTGALTMRYAIVTTVGFALIVAYLTSTIERARRACAMAIVLSFYFSLIFSFTFKIRDNFSRSKVSTPQPLEQFISRAERPVVFSDAGNFLQKYHYLPQQLREPIYFLTDRASARKYPRIEAAIPTSEIALHRLKRIVPINVVDFSDFKRRNRQFFVLDRGAGWLIGKLSEDRANLVLHSTVSDYQVFLVSLMP